MKLLVIQDNQLRRTVRAAGGRLAIGSDPSCDVHLPDPKLLKHQASLALDETGNWWLEVQDPSVPTCLNRAVQKARAQLKHADEIEIGPFALRFYLDPAATAEERRTQRVQKLEKQLKDTLPLDTIIRKDDDRLTLPAIAVTQTADLLAELRRYASVGDLLLPVLNRLIHDFNGSKAWMGIRKPNAREFDWVLGSKGGTQPCKRPSYSQMFESRCLCGRQHLCAPHVPVAGIASAMAAPLVGRDRDVLGMVYVETASGGTRYDDDAFMRFSAVAQIVATRVHDLLISISEHEAETVSTELELARALQSSLTVDALPEVAGLQAAAYRLAGADTCSDYYDIVATRTKKVLAVVAKVEADPLTRLRYLGELRAAFRYAALYQEAPHTFLRALNWLLLNNAGNSIHLMIAEVDPSNGLVQFCIAGRRVHTGRISPNGDGELIPLAGAPPVGADRGAVYELREMTLEEGQALLIVTDGAKTTLNRDGAALGIGGAEEAVCDGLGDTPAHVLRDFAADLADYVDGGAHPEDLTVALVRRD